MDVLAFGAEVVAVSASGVLAPGPLFVANMMYGTRQGALSGIKVAHGHAVVEIVVIAVIAAGLFSASAFIADYASVIAIIGGVSIIGFAILQIVGIITTARKSKQERKTETVRRKNGPFAAGVMFSALNPFFLVWWLTVGLKLVSDSAAFGAVAGPALLFGMHVWMDYVWLAATAYLASKGSSVLKSKYYRVLMLVLAGLLLYYGVQFLINGVMMIIIK
ncbi:putative threonine efflux protein [Candidatus Nitrososphaera evergladensis SR1]|jgi:threonine/homoserine/homoserine lactone efflux protein|uniref:Putative threonine efflux protein n=2 Tax=Nitrososphaera TaxID=497726 RepID=A0A075MRJ9_9ARCH|nr:putative threonine efflux protein [Candidatus Nitrososphaera evergladensis SR1]